MMVFTSLVLGTGAFTSDARGDSTRKIPRAAPTLRPAIANIDRMSAMGQRAQQEQRRMRRERQRALGMAELEKKAEVVDDPDGRALGIRSETSIAVANDGQHVVIGFNDFRGFLADPALPLSISGFQYSDNGGQTFVDGGQLPVTTGISEIFGQLFPQVFGDPDVKFVGGCTFIYSSVVLARFSDTSVVQTLGIHRSTDCGHTWEGPFEVPSATNPNGAVDPNGDPLDAADKEFLDMDPVTGRVILSWTNFTAGNTEMSTAFSDNITAAVPTWSDRVIVSAADADGQGSIPRFGGGGHAYIAWSRFPGGNSIDIGFAHSEDNGATWSTPINLSAAPFFGPDQILGNDRVNANPSMAVDRSQGVRRGNVYITYGNNDAKDGADIVFQRSTDHGQTFSQPIVLSSRPGSDRSQWFPWVTVDNSNGRVFVFYYDQGIAASGDLSETTFTFSNDGGNTWAQPRPLTRRPFRAGHGNDTSQPNLGDYNQAEVRNGRLYAVWAGTRPVGFTDGQPSPFFTVPEVNFRRVGQLEQLPIVSVALGAVGSTDSGGDGDGFLDPGETVNLTLPLTNYVTNPISDRNIGGALAIVSTPTPGVNVISGLTTYEAIPPGQTRSNRSPIRLRLRSTFLAGTDIELKIVVLAITGLPTTLLHTLHTGTPVETVLLAENFDGVAPGLLPSGWLSAHGAGANNVPWTTSTTFCGTPSNAAFHVNADDGPSGGSPARWERLIGPSVAIPAGAQYVTLEFDVCNDTEDDPAFNVLGYDGFFLRVTDLTPGHLVRSNLAEAFATEFTTGSFFHYPKHLPRNGEPGYFPEGDMSVWGGDSQGIRHVKMRLPGMAATTAQLRFEYTQDGSFTCADVRPGHSCGVLIDNVVVKSVVSQP